MDDGILAASDSRREEERKAKRGRREATHAHQPRASVFSQSQTRGARELEEEEEEEEVRQGEHGGHKEEDVREKEQVQ